MSSRTDDRSRRSPRSTATMPAIARRISGGAGVERGSRLSSPGRETLVTPCPPQAMAQAPIGVSKRAWPVGFIAAATLRPAQDALAVDEDAHVQELLLAVAEGPDRERERAAEQLVELTAREHLDLEAADRRRVAWAV